MRPAFIIMQIGNEELDRAAASAIVPALTSTGFDARRVDKHNRGELLKSEIVKFIEESDVIVADLTNERPNCYLEVGYVMGTDKFANLILTVREDHFPDSSDHKIGGPKVHFDLAGYDILAWRPDKLDMFRTELEKRIRRRLQFIDANPISAEDNQNASGAPWLLQQRDAAQEGMAKTKFAAFMEVAFVPTSRVERFALQKLNDAANASRITTFGWPIAPYIDREEYRPRPTSQGIVAQISIDDESGKSYDYWAIRNNGEFYCRNSLFEDEKDVGKIFFDVRIMRVTEIFLYCKNLYTKLGFNPEHIITIHVRHLGLRGRRLTGTAARSRLRPLAPSLENESEAVLYVRLDEIETNLTALVKEALAPMFSLFDFFELSDSTYEEIVQKFARGQL